MKKVFLIIFILSLFQIYDIGAVRKPTVSFSASPTKISLGQSSKLTWSTSYATSASIDNGIGAVTLKGSKTVTPTQTTTYTITVKGSGGTVTAKATVTVTGPPTVTMTASPESIFTGESATLTWSSTNATSASIDNGVGTVPVNGTKSVSPVATTTYKITVTGSGGSAYATATVTVKTLPTVSISANPMAIGPGGSSVLTWITTNATSASIDNDIGPVQLNDSISVSPTVTTTYTISVVGQNGTAQAQAQVYVNDGKRYLAYLNYGSNLTEVDLLTNQVGITRQCLSTPDNVFPSLDGTRVFTGHASMGSSSSWINVYDASGLEVIQELCTLEGGWCFRWACHPDGRHFYFLNKGYNSSTGKTYPLITVLRKTGNNNGCLQFVAQYSCDTYYDSWNDIAISPDGSRLYVSDCNTLRKSKIYTLDTNIMNNSSGSKRNINEVIVNSFETPEIISNIYLVRQGAAIYGMVLYTDKIIAIDTVSGAVLGNITFPETPYHFKSLADGNRAYAASSSSKIYAVDTQSHSIIATIPLDFSIPYPSGMSLYPDGSRLYILNSSGKKIHVLDTQTNTLVSQIDLSSLSSNPQGITIGYAAPALEGKVVDSSAGVADVTVQVTGDETNRFLNTDANGHYQMAVKKGDYSLTYEKIGFDFVPPSLSINVDQEGIISLEDIFATSVPPTVSLDAVPTLIKKGRPTLLKYSTRNAESASIDNNIGSIGVNVEGERWVYPASTATFTLTATGPGGTANAPATVTVVDKILPTVTLMTQPDNIDQGQSTTLTWTSTAAASASINNGIGTVPVNGSMTVKPSSTTTYAITVINEDGQATAQATVTVKVIPPPTINITADPLYLLMGQSSTITWTSTGGTSASMDNGIGTVPLNSSVTVSPKVDTTYTLTVTGPGGSAVYEIIITTQTSAMYAVWNGMKTALANGDIDTAVNFFCDETRLTYKEIFETMNEKLSLMLQEMQDIEPVSIDENNAQFRIIRHEIWGGKEYDISYFIYLIKQEDSSWKIWRF